MKFEDLKQDLLVNVWNERLLDAQFDNDECDAEYAQSMIDKITPIDNLTDLSELLVEEEFWEEVDVQYWSKNLVA